LGGKAQRLPPPSRAARETAAATQPPAALACFRPVRLTRNSPRLATNFHCGTDNTSRPNDRFFAVTRNVMLVHAGHPGVRLQQEGKSWMPTIVGMTLAASQVGQSFGRLI
jgi:hypothetical protein